MTVFSRSSLNDAQVRCQESMNNLCYFGSELVELFRSPKQKYRGLDRDVPGDTKLAEADGLKLLESFHEYGENKYSHEQK